MKGETVTLIYPGDGGKDDFKNDVHTGIPQDVSNVLVQTANTQNDTDSNRPNGTRAQYRLMFPKLFVYGIDPDIFRGATVIVREKPYKVIGNPGYYDDENCPTEWCMSVYVEAIDG